MEVKIKGMKYEDFKDNEYIEQLMAELKESGTNVVVGCLDELINWAAPILCGRLLLQPVAAVLSFYLWAPHVMTWPVLGSK